MFTLWSFWGSTQTIAQGLASLPISRFALLGIQRVLPQESLRKSTEAAGSMRRVFHALSANLLMTWGRSLVGALLQLLVVRGLLHQIQDGDCQRLLPMACDSCMCATRKPPGPTGQGHEPNLSQWQGHVVKPSKLAEHSQHNCCPWPMGRPGPRKDVEEASKEQACTENHKVIWFPPACPPVLQTY